MFLAIQLSKNSQFSYAAYSLERRILRLMERGGRKVASFEAVPIEVFRSFPSGITGGTYFLTYIKARYANCFMDWEVAAMEDPTFPRELFVPSPTLREQLAAKQAEWELRKAEEVANGESVPTPPPPPTKRSGRRARPV